jgi:hypothetical protein
MEIDAEAANRQPLKSRGTRWAAVSAAGRDLAPAVSTASLEKTQRTSAIFSRGYSADAAETRGALAVSGNALVHRRKAPTSPID